LGQTDSLLAANPWYERFAETAVIRQRRWREFLVGEDPREEEVRRAEGVLGPEAFGRRFADRHGRRVERRRGRPAKEFPPNLFAEMD